MADQPTAPRESFGVSEPDRERRLGEVLAGYFAAVEAGTGPTPQELIARHPELARELEGFFADQERFGRLVAPLRPMAQATQAEASTLAGAEATMPASQFVGTESAATQSLIETRGLIPDQDAAPVEQTESPGSVAHANGDPDRDRPRGTRVRYVGDYELGSILGRGGMGVVYRARQVSLNRAVALKMIKAGVLAGDDELRRFQIEAEVVALLDHPGIVPVYEIGEHEGQKYFSMKLILGGSLAERLATYKDDSKAAATLLAESAEAVHHAHMRGILHRDLKPANILIDAEGHGHITDFGLAKRIKADAEITVSGAVLGTPAYMAPEQATGRRGAITTATDVHGLGSVLYALLTGQAPFAGDSVVDTLTKVKEQPPESPRKLNASVPRDLEVICLKCLEKDPRRRYASAQAVADDLRAWLETRPILARPAGRLEMTVKWARRRPAIAALSALVVLVSLIGLGGVLSQWREAVVARRAAVEKAQAEAEARAEATHLAANLQGQTYSLALALAQREWEGANIAQVERLLDLCAPRLRRWEWDRLRHLCHLEERTIPAPGNHAAWDFLCWRPDGTRLAGLSTVTGRPAGGWNADYPAHAQIVDTAHEDRPVVLVPAVFRAAWDAHGQQLLVFKVKPKPDRTPAEELATVDPATGATTRLWSVPAARFAINDVAWSPDRRRVAVSRSIGTGSDLRVWDTRTGEGERVLAGHRDQVYAVAWSADNKRLASASQDGTIRVWDPDTGASVLTLAGHAGEVQTVAWSPDGERLATGGQDQTARIWDARTGRTTAVLSGHGGKVNAVAWRPDGSSVATTGDDRTVRLWDSGTGKLLAILRGHADRVFRLAWKPDGSRLASASEDQTIKIWDPAYAGESLELDGHPAEVKVVAWSPDNRLVATAGGDPLVRLWDAATGRLISKFEGHSETVYALSFSPDGKRVATTSSDLTARIWNVATGASVATFANHKSHAYAVAWSPDSQLVATGGLDLTLRIWDPSTATERLSVRATSKDTGCIMGVSWSPDSSRIALALGSPDNAVIVLDASTGRSLMELSGHNHALSAVAWSRDSLLLASSSLDKTCRVWDATTGTLRATLVGHGGFVWSVAWNHDGTRLATAGADGSIKLWDPSDGTEVLTIPGHSGNIWSVAWSPDGASLVSAGADRRVRIWTSRAPAAR